MAKATLEERIPKILEQRLLIKKNHRRLLKTIEALSPSDTGNLYVPGVNSFRPPRVDQIAEKLNLTEKTIRKQINEIKDIWSLPDQLPTANGNLTNDEALISALTNQHKLRWDPQIKDYRVPELHMFNSELGTGTIYTRNKSFEGEMIVRDALGLDEMLNSYNVQGGILPPVMSMYGALKAESASLVGLNKTGKTVDPEEVEKLKNYFDAALAELDNEELFSEIDDKTLFNLEHSVANTIDSQEEAARSVPHELAPQYQNIPSHVPIHWFFSFNDDYNMRERGDVLIAKMRFVRESAKRAKFKLPILKEELSARKNRIAQTFLNESIGNYVMENFKDEIEAGMFDIKDEETGETIDQKIPSGKKFRHHIRDAYFTEKDEAKLRKKLLKPFKSNYGKVENFDRLFQNAVERYAFSSSVSGLESVNERMRVDQHKKAENEERIPNIEDTVSEYTRYLEALKAEEGEGHAWFTKKVAMTPTETKAQRMIAKASYKALYTNIVIPELEKIVGHSLNIKLHTDPEISVFVPEPGKMLGMNAYSDDLLNGTIIASYPRINRQDSNIPTLNSYARLQAKHAANVANRVKSRAERPKTINEFDKNNSLGWSDVAWTSWGAEGFLVQPKLVIAPTRMKGEYRGPTETVHFLKTPTRHDTGKLSEMAHKGNRGTNEIKRLEKGGGTTGSTYQIKHPDRSVEWTFSDDAFFEKIAEEYGVQYTIFKSKLDRARSESAIQKWGLKLETLKEKIAEEAELNNIFLANDYHLGNANLAGRPNNIDMIRGSVIPALQAIGFENISAYMGTEFCNGGQAWKSYNAMFEGEHDNQQSELENEWLLSQGLRTHFKKEGFEGEQLEAKINAHMSDYSSELKYVRPSFRIDDQIEMYRNIVQPVTKELLENDTKVFLGSGNHFGSTVRGTQDEATRLEQLYDIKYSKTGQLMKVPANGNGFTIRPVRLPGDILSGEKYEGVPALFAHKMQSGNTEIGQLSKQGVGIRDDLQLIYTSDRHHPGMGAERGKYFVLDTGEATVVDFVQNIGKSSSVRGTVTSGYSPHGNQLFSARFFLDDVVDTIIGWPERAERQRLNQEILKQEMSNIYN